jgi:disulfide bond formation protein DsbB
LNWPGPRLFFTCIALVCAALLGFGYYLEFVKHLDPCPMCIFQRLCYFTIVVAAALGALHGPRGPFATLYTALIVLAAGVGAGIAGRQTWLQHLPAERVPECGPGLEFMLEQYPLAEVIKKALRGSGECAAVDWTFLTLSIAEWSLLCFIGLIIASVAWWRAPRRRAG